MPFATESSLKDRRVRTYVIEPQLVFVPYLERMLRDAGMSVVATSSDVDGKDIAALQPAAVLVDVDYFERGGPHAICRIRQVAKSAAVIAFSGSDDPTFEAACYISGASAVCSKREGIDKLLSAMRRAVSGSYARPLASPA